MFIVSPATPPADSCQLQFFSLAQSEVFDFSSIKGGLKTAAADVTGFVRHDLGYFLRIRRSQTRRAAGCSLQAAFIV